jgi:general secretion pathway protein C
VARRDFDAMVANPEKLLRQVQVSPSGGGYRLSGIHAGSQVSQLGFRNGDVITAVNGTRLDDQLGLLGLYAGLDSTRSYNVTYQRGGARHTRTIRLRD